MLWLWCCQHLCSNIYLLCLMTTCSSKYWLNHLPWLYMKFHSGHLVLWAYYLSRLRKRHISTCFSLICEIVCIRLKNKSSFSYSHHFYFNSFNEQFFMKIPKSVAISNTPGWERNCPAGPALSSSVRSTEASNEILGTPVRRPLLPLWRAGTLCPWLPRPHSSTPWHFPVRKLELGGTMGRWPSSQLTRFPNETTSQIDRLSRDHGLYLT